MTNIRAGEPLFFIRFKDNMFYEVGFKDETKRFFRWEDENTPGVLRKFETNSNHGVLTQESSLGLVVQQNEKSKKIFYPAWINSKNIVLNNIDDYNTHYAVCINSISPYYFRSVGNTEGNSKTIENWVMGKMPGIKGTTVIEINEPIGSTKEADYLNNPQMPYYKFLFVN